MTSYDFCGQNYIFFVGQGYHRMQAVGAFPVCGILDMKNPNLNNVSVKVCSSVYLFWAIEKPRQLKSSEIWRPAGLTCGPI